MTEILIPIAIMAGLGIVLAVLLGYAAEVFAVKQEPKVEEILLVLPGVNCGGCGFAGC